MMLRFSLLVLLPLASESLIRQNQLFGDGMVLESREAYDIRPFVSGFGTVVGEPVSVSFNGKTYNTTVGEDLNWDVQMDCCDRETGKTLVVAGRDNTLSYTDVACGQVPPCTIIQNFPAGSEAPGLPTCIETQSCEMGQVSSEVQTREKVISQIIGILF